MMFKIDCGKVSAVKAECRRLCSAINQRNRLRNLEHAVEASKREVAEMKQAKADPFTRRQCRPTLVTKVTLLSNSLTSLAVIPESDSACN